MFAQLINEDKLRGNEAIFISLIFQLIVSRAAKGYSLPGAPAAPLNPSRCGTPSPRAGSGWWSAPPGETSALSGQAAGEKGPDGKEEES